MLLIRENLEVKCFQYADDTTIYDHAKVYDLNKYKNTIAQEYTLALKNDKTKVMILSTPQMSGVHHLTTMILTSQSVDIN